MIYRAELRKILGDMRAYWFELLFGNLNVLVTFVGLYFAFGVYGDDTPRRIVFFSGVLFWYFGVHGTDLLTTIMEEEMESGTMDQLLMSRSSLAGILSGKIMAQFTADALKGLIVFPLLILLTRTNLLSAGSEGLAVLLLVFIGSLVAMFGVGATLAGLALVYKRVSALGAATTNFMLYLVGMTVPLAELPVWARSVGRALPMSWGGEIVMDVFRGGNVRAAPVVGMTVSALLWVAVGMIVFRIMQRRSRVLGSTSQY